MDRNEIVNPLCRNCDLCRKVSCHQNTTLEPGHVNLPLIISTVT